MVLQVHKFASYVCSLTQIYPVLLMTYTKMNIRHDRFENAFYNPSFLKRQMVRSTCHRGWIFILTIINDRTILCDQHNQGLRHYNFQILEHSFNFEDILQIHGSFHRLHKSPEQGIYFLSYGARIAISFSYSQEG